MKRLTSEQIRKMWLKFFEQKGHYVVPSGSLIPIDDDSLLWVNAGVATLKKYFDGSEKPPSPRLTNAQKSIRTGDIENIGITARHHTFFEMVGNFSIGDYFKTEAIQFAFEILTNENLFAFPIEKLWVTVFEDDEEAIETWVKAGFPRERIFKMGRDTNFWDMGKGPCGPSSEIFFDRGEKYDSRTAEELIAPDLENDRFVEVWNIVFSQFNNDGKGNYTELPQKNIDTGAGLERLASVFQDTPTNFETDLFKPIIEEIVKISGKEYVFDYIPGQLDEEQEEIQRAMKQIADFARTATFAIGDGVIPSNNGRGYVIRRLLRKAVASGQKLGINEEFIYRLVSVIANIMDSFYPQVRDNLEIIESKIKAEETQFAKTLSKSTEMLVKLIEETEDKKLDSEKVFELFETHGLPFEFIEDIATSNNKEVSKEDFDKLMHDFQDKSRANQKVGDAMTEQNQIFRGVEATEFIGYENLETKAKVIAIDGNNVATDKTTFYATSGGQEFDHGTVEGIKVTNIYKNGDNVIIHELEKEPTFNVGDEIDLTVDGLRRTKLMRNHSAVHLSFKALEKALDYKVPQVGSKIEEDFFRFDFTYHKDVSKEVLTQMEDKVDSWINQGVNCDIRELPLAEAKELGATFLEGTKYGEVVRVVNFEGVTIDLCGGTHVSNSADVQEYKLVNIEKKGSGIYRITGTAGQDNVQKVLEQLAKESVQKAIEEITNLKTVAHTDSLIEIKERAIKALDHEPTESVLETARKEIKEINEKLTSDIKAKFEEVENGQVLDFINVDKKPLQSIIKDVTGKLEDEIIFIVNHDEDTSNAFFILGKNLATDEKVVSLIKDGANKIGIRGGGNRQMYSYGGQKQLVEQLISKVKEGIDV